MVGFQEVNFQGDYYQVDHYQFPKLAIQLYFLAVKTIIHSSVRYDEIMKTFIPRRQSDHSNNYLKRLVSIESGVLEIIHSCLLFLLHFCLQQDICCKSYYYCACPLNIKTFWSQNKIFSVDLIKSKYLTQLISN